MNNTFAPLITVAIATYNRASFLPGLFDSILNQTLDKDKFEVLLIDNNSNDLTATLCRTFIDLHPDYHIRYMVEKNQGLSFGRNRGIAESIAPYITFADDDALMAPDFLANTVDYLENHPSVGEVGGPILLRYMDTIPSWGNRYMDSLFGYFCPSHHPFKIKSKNRFYPRGSNMTFRTVLLHDIGGFNIRLGRIKGRMLGGEEKDIAYRLIDKGVEITYQPHLVVYHLVPRERTTREFIRRQALGIGRSEQLRSRSTKSYMQRFILECGKWVATLGIALFYIIRLQRTKATMLIRFRYWISRGLLERIE